MYIVFVYAAFWLLLVLTGVVALVFDNQALTKAMTVFCSWTPTIVLMTMFKKLCPGRTLKDFFRLVLNGRINFLFMLVITLIELLIFTASGLIMSISKEVSMLNVVNFSLSSVSTNLLFSIITGATGEEFGWRGFLSPILTGKYGVIKGSLSIGLIWCFWHTPLWFLTTGLSGLDLVKYVLYFIIAIISIAVIIGVCYNNSKNIAVPMWIHFPFNFFCTFFGDKIYDAFIWISLLHSVTALGFVLWHINRSNKLNCIL